MGYKWLCPSEEQNSASATAPCPATSWVCQGLQRGANASPGPSSASKDSEPPAELPATNAPPPSGPTQVFRHILDV